MADGNPVDAMESDESLSALLPALVARAESVLNAHPRTRGLIASLPHADASPLRIALLGPYSAGKSMLVAALLRLSPAAVDELVDAAPKTHEPTPYPWNGVTLVDLPGTLSGNDEHFRAARRGVRGADALMIVTTSELPGEAETTAILQALDTDGFADRSVVVVNKMNAENNDRDVILEEIRKRLGPFADRVPIVPTDARDYVEAVNNPDLTSAQRDLLLAESGINALTAELQRIIAPGVSAVRPNAQAFELLRVLRDAEQKWVLEGEELHAAETAKKVEEAISQAKASVLSTLGRGSGAVASVIRSAGSKIAASLSEKDDVPTDVARDLASELALVLAEFEFKFSESMRTAFEALVAEYGTDVPEPEAWVNDPDGPEATIDASPDAELRFARAVREGAENAAKAGGRRIREWIEEMAASDSEQGSTASNVATRIIKSRVGQKVLDAGGAVTNGAGKFRPWGRSKGAAKLAGAASKAQWVLTVIGPSLVEWKSVAQDQAERMKLDKRRKMIRRHSEEEALRQQTSLTDAGNRHLSKWIAEVEESLSGSTRQGAEITAEREKALGAIRGLRDEAEKLVRIAPGS
ncbi:GTPase [Actinacidiphila glaucinigra]|uniref:GTPase n=1 Tax=Actinacidiphila glaucinigra TaxID=235986 RepID=UPI0035DF4C88